MTALIAQILGIGVTLSCLLSCWMKRKWQILLVSGLGNLAGLIMVVLLEGSLTSGAMMNLVAVMQCAVLIVLDRCGKKDGTVLKILFLLLYLAAGFLQYHRPLDLLPISGAILFMCGAFQKKEQMIRGFGAMNALVWLGYYLILHSTAALGEVFGLVSAVLAIVRYRKAEKKDDRAEGNSRKKEVDKSALF